MWIKICGNTNLEDALFAAKAGADALGFIFAPSPRHISLASAREIISKLPAGIGKYGVFVDAGLQEIAATVTGCGLTGVQIHRSSYAGGNALLPAQLKRHFVGSAGGLDILVALNYQNRLAFEQQLSDLGLSGSTVDAVLVDSSSARAVGGTGTCFDWSEASESFAQFAPLQRLVAAGGLAPENVAQAVTTLRPWGVDVVSGVESSKGKKDPQRVLAFIQAAQRAGKEIEYAVQQ